MLQTLNNQIDGWLESVYCIVKDTLAESELIIKNPEPDDWLNNDYNQESLQNHLYRNLRCNLCQWVLEDRARAKSANCQEVADIKRHIDAFNQMRNDEVEMIDRLLLKSYFPDMRDDVPIFSETPGSILDRLHILCIKKVKYKEIADIQKVSMENSIRSIAQESVSIIDTQIINLEQALNYLFISVAAKSMCFRNYYQLKMYNDPRFAVGFCGSGDDNNK